MVSRNGGLAYKFVSPSQRGVPDRVVIWPGGHLHFVELKTHSGVCTPIQELRQKEIVERGHFVINLYGLRQIEDYIVNCVASIPELKEVV